MHLTNNMSKGKPLSLIVKFAFPLLMGNLAQQIYIITDSFIVGKGIGLNGLAALGSVDWFTWIFLSSIISLAHGFSVVISKSFGSNDKNLKNYIYSSYILGFIISIIMTIFSLCFYKKILVLINTPIEIFDYALAYVKHLFLGLIIIMFYNIFSSTLRALGNSKAPFIAMFISAILNIILDIIFIFYLHLQIEYVAIATLISQMVALLYCYSVLAKIKIISTNEKFIFMPFKLLKVALPLFFTNYVIGIGGMALQSVINLYGNLFVVAYTIGNKIYSTLETIALSLSFALSTFISLNLGANNIKRIKQSIREVSILAILISIVISLFLFIFSKNIISIFTNDIYVLKYGLSYLNIISLFLSALFLSHIYKAIMQGLNNGLLPLFSSILELVVRVSLVFVLSKFLAYKSVFYAEIFSWIVSIVVLVWYYLFKEKLH